jgi:hypothetical protein
MKSKHTRLIVALALAVALVLSMGISAFAAPSTNTSLYVKDTYGTTNTPSMGDPAVVGATYAGGVLTVDVTAINNVNNYTGYTGYISAFTLGNVLGIPGYTDSDENPDYFTFIISGLTTGANELNASFNIDVYDPDDEPFEHPGGDNDVLADFVVTLP